MALLSFKANRNLVPRYICNKFTPINETHTINTRSASFGNLVIPKPNCEIFKQSLSYNAAKTWNSFSEEIRNCSTISLFKTTYNRTKLK